jgi:hypothetical protein
MKILGIIAVILAIVGVLIGLYCQISIVPACDSLFSGSNNSESEMMLLRGLADKKFLFGSLALFLGPISVVMGLIVGIKKIKIGWLAVVLGIVSFVFGALQATHMFS